MICALQNLTRESREKHETTKPMNSTILKGQWNVIKGRLKQTYGTLTDDDLAFEEGKDEETKGRLQKALGQTKEQVEELLKKFSNP